MRRTATGRAIKPSRARANGYNLMLSDDERALLVEVASKLGTSRREVVIRALRYYAAVRPFERTGAEW